LNQKFLNVFLLALLNLSVMASLRNLPIVSEYGFGCIFIYLIVALLFLLPVSLISAELASGWPEAGGVYAWVREAFGPKWGLFAVWMQWVHNVTWFPAILSFSATTLAYLINPALASNTTYITSFILIGFWAFTFFNYFGIKTSSWFSALGVVAGTIIPGLLIVLFAAIWLSQGNPSQISFSLATFIPSLNRIDNLVFIAGLFLAFGGLEVSAAHVREVQNPQRNFPRAIAMAAIIALLLYAFGALAIAMVIPQEEISLVAGLMEAFGVFLKNWHLEAWLPVLAFLIVFGAVGELNAWIIGPVRALHATERDGEIPPILQKLNRHKMPANLLFLQGIIVSIAALIFLFMPSASAAFWALSAMSAQLYILMYILLFAAGIVLRYKKPNVLRPYRVPFQNVGMWVLGLSGILACVFAYIIGFFPPSQIDIGSLPFYLSFLVIGNLVLSILPLIIYRFKNDKWISYEP
jgi:putative glutamate/gamma-aminobutyrate antiporter